MNTDCSSIKLITLVIQIPGRARVGELVIMRTRLGLSIRRTVFRRTLFLQPGYLELVGPKMGFWEIEK